MPYFNTTHLNGEALEKERENASTQERTILRLFQLNPFSYISPDMAQVMVGMENVPITSIRRAISNLTKNGHLEKTPVKAKGKYGKPTYTWRLRPSN